MSRVDWQYPNANMLALGRAIRVYVQQEKLDVIGGVILITLGDPAVSMQYLGPNRVNGADLVGYLEQILIDLHAQPMEGDRPNP